MKLSALRPSRVARAAASAAVLTAVLGIGVPPIAAPAAAAIEDASAPAQTEAATSPDAHGEEPEHEAAPPLAVIGRWVTYVGLFLALGVSIFHRVALREGSMPTALVRWLAAGLVVSGIATAGMAILTAGESSGTVEFGVWRGGFAVAAAAALMLIPRRAASGVAGLAGFAGIVLLVLSTHGSADRGVDAILSQLVHVTGAAIWVSGVVVIVALTRWPAVVIGSARVPMRTVIPRFSAVALVAVGLVVLTGVHTAIVETGVLIDLRTEFGHTLLMKSGFAAGALALGMLNFIDGGRMMPWLDGLRSRVTIELMLITTVLVMTAALASTHSDAPAAASSVGELAVAAALLAGGTIGLGFTLTGRGLPRCEPAASRVALIVAGTAAIGLGVIIGAARLVG